VAANFLRDGRTLLSLARPRRRTGSLADRLSAFYAPQAGDYDRFRARLLHGRHSLLARLPARPGDVWIDFGGGTGSNLAALGSRIRPLRQVYLIDLARPLLDVARKRAARHGWTNVTLLEADAGAVDLPDGCATVALFSYSLTMMPEWRRAIDTAHRLLAPGGAIGVVDFYVSERDAAPLRQHSPLTRRFWPWWFGLCDVFPNPQQLAYLRNRFAVVALNEREGTVPYLPGLKAPYYQFIGRR
jgi:S-adenosylmethionine-diacylgycerolhomoserine-N-methlytransferase